MMPAPLLAFLAVNIEFVELDLTHLFLISDNDQAMAKVFRIGK